MTEQQTIPTSEVLNRAADLIERDGWTDGPEGMQVDGPHCIQGAIQAAVGAGTWGLGCDRYHYLDVIPCAAGEAVRTYLGARNFMSVWMWNDRDGRTAAEVIETLRATAVIEGAREQAGAEVSA